MSCNQDLEASSHTSAEAAAVPRRSPLLRALGATTAVVAAVGVVGATLNWSAATPAGSRTEIVSAAANVAAVEEVENSAQSQVRRTAKEVNPFQDKDFYVNPSYAEELGVSIESAEGEVKANLQAMSSFASAYWLDVKAKIHGEGSKTLEGILTDAAAKPTPPVVTFIVYDLPNRDCHAKASNGEICCTYLPDGRCDYFAGGTCDDGLKEYETEYIDPIASVLSRAEFQQVPVVLVIEPDSLPNLATNWADKRCGNTATATAYKSGIAYAVKELAAKAPLATIYLDAGHGGWLGWKNNMRKFVRTIEELGIAEHLRGFATNVAGYQGLGSAMCPTYDYCLNNAHPEAECCRDPCHLVSEWNPSNNELNYALHLHTAFSGPNGIAGFSPHMIIDTGRNGVEDARSVCKNWCNIRGAGVGLSPTTATANPDIIDAYFWLKTPGESDGCTRELPDGQTCPRFDLDCGSMDSLGSSSSEPRAPEAGLWFDYQVKQLAQNARMSA